MSAACRTHVGNEKCI